MSTPTGGDVYVLPTSFGQQRLWFLDQLQPGSAAYNLASAVRLSGALDLDCLGRALDWLVQRHESLRTTFARVDGEPVQVVSTAAVSVLARDDLTREPAACRDARAREIVSREAATPFDLARGPLLRVRALCLAPDDHVLALVLHHAVGDGWSLGLLIAELTRAYAALVRGVEPDLPALTLQYGDYAHWQREWLRGDALASQLAYWRRQLAGVPALLDLPTDRARSERPAFRGGKLGARLPAALAAALTAFAQGRQATPFMILLAAFQALLQRFTGASEVAVGTPVANRGRTELEGLIGFFANTLVLRTDLSDDPTFVELLARVRETALAAYAHQDVPFEQLVEDLRPARSLAHHPLFQVMFVLQNTPRPAALPSGGGVRPFEFDAGAAKFDLTLAAWEGSDGGFGLALEYRSDLFEAETAGALLQAFEPLVRGALAEPATRLSRLPLAAPEERSALGAAGRAGDVEPAPCTAVHERIAAQVRRTPQAAAVELDGRALDYAELWARVCGVAARLRAHGVGPEVRVGLLCERSPELIVGLLGILEAGGAYVALDVRLPPARLADLLRRSGAALVLTSSRSAPALPPDGPARLVLDAEPGAAWAPAAEGRAGHSLAYVAFTSGSTGQPRGVAVSHAALAARVAAMAATYGLGPGQRVLQFISVGFDAAAEEIFPTLACGATLVLHPEPTALAPAELLAECRRRGITCLHLPAATWHPLVDHAVHAGAELPHALRTTIVGGERLSPERAAAWLRLSPEAALFNAYGPTETTVTATVERVAAAGLETCARVPIGKPLAWTAAHVLDGEFHPLPAGVPGELFLGGPGVARGYVEAARETAASFVPDPFSLTPGARLYRTGDRVRRLADGRLDFLGRRDGQLKLRGHRIEPREIEAALEAHAAVRQALVDARPPGSPEARLVAYVVAEKQPPTEAELRAFLSARLPAALLPAAFVFVERLALNAHGKLDRRALPDPGARRPDLAVPFEEPRGEIECALARLWREALAVERVGRHDGFFDLGGHSLLLAKVHAAVQAEFGIEVTLLDLFLHPTVAALAAHLAGAEPRRDGRALAAERARRQREARRRRRPAADDAGVER